MPKSGAISRPDFTAGQGNEACRHAVDDAPAANVRAGGINEGGSTLRQIGKIAARYIYPAVSVDIRRFVELAMEGASEMHVPIDQPAYSQMHVGHAGEGFKNKIEPLLDEAVAAHPEKVVTAGIEVLVLAPGIGDRHRVRHLEDALPGEGIGLISEIVPKKGGAIGGFDGAVHLDQPVTHQRDIPARLHLLHASEGGGVMVEPMRDIEVDDLDAGGRELRCELLEIRARAQEEIVVPLRLELMVKIVDEVDAVAELEKDPGQQSAFNQVVVTQEQGIIGFREIAFDLLRDQDATARRALRLERDRHGTHRVEKTIIAAIDLPDHPSKGCGEHSLRRVAHVGSFWTALADR